jgi:hypothetical protein
MPQKTAFTVKLRRQDTGEEHERLILSHDQTTAESSAIERAMASLKTMADRKYGKFEVLSCTRRS